MNDVDVIAWYQSKIIWTQIVGVVMMLLSQVIELPAGLTVDAVVTAILSIMAVVTIVFRKTGAPTVIGKPDNTVG